MFSMTLRSLKVPALVLGAAVIVGMWLVVVDAALSRIVTLIALS